MKKIRDALYFAWTIALKDVRDAFMNKGTRTNILVLIGLVFFFYWMSNLRPFDKEVDVVFFNQSSVSYEFEQKLLGDGSEFSFREASSMEELEKKMAYQDLGIILPEDFAQQVNAGEQIRLPGYVHWSKRGQVSDLENQYSTMFSEQLGVPVEIEIGENILLPPFDALGMASTAGFHIFFAISWMALTVVPFLIIEERKAKTLDALMVSPASPGVVVFGKAIAGMLLVIAIAGFSIVLNGTYIVSWGWAAVGFTITALFAIGLALLLGTLMRDPQHILLWMLPVAFVFVVPGFFADEPNLTQAAKSVLDWLPGVAINRIIGFAVSDGSATTNLGINLVIGIASIILIYALVIWQIRRSDR